MTKHRIRSLTLLAILSVFTFTTIAQPVYAADEVKSDTQFYSDNDILYYDKSAKECVASSTDSGMGVVSSKDIVKAAAEGAATHRAAYEEAAKKNDIPWQLLAAIHYRETAYGTTNPANGQGIFQFAAEAGNYPAGPVSEENFKVQANYAASRLKTDYSTRGVSSLSGAAFSFSNSDANKVKDTAFSYNGRAGVYATQAANLGFNKDTQPYEGSPYVMNFYDDKRDPTKAAGGTWGQILTDGGGISYPANSQVGIYTIYAALGGGTASASVDSCGKTSSSGGGGAIVDIMKAELAKGTTSCRTTTAGQCGAYTDNNAEDWCADFVSWVYKESGKPFTGGASGGWRIPGVYALDDYLAANAIHFKPTDTSNAPQPGDVIIFNEGGPRMHTGLVLEVSGTKITTVEGNMNDSVMSRTFDNYKTEPNFYAFARMK